MTKFLTTKRGGRMTKLALALVTAWASGGLVACADNTNSLVTAPPPPSVAPTIATKAAPAAYFGSLASTSLLSRQMVGDTTVTQFTLNPRSPLSFYDIGNQSKIFFPLGASSVCDPSSSGYGIGLWDAPCAPLTSSITITAKSWVDPITGGVNTDFSPELRFVPAPIGVTLFLHDQSPSPTDLIDYCSNGVCVDDSKVDGSLITNSDGSGFVFRVIKHFSGYNVVVN